MSLGAALFISTFERSKDVAKTSSLIVFSITRNGNIEVPDRQQRSVLNRRLRTVSLVVRETRSEGAPPPSASAQYPEVA